MNFEFQLPLWAIFYCGLIFANGVITIIMSHNKTKLYVLAQLLSTAFMISFFFIHYGAVARGSDDMVLFAMLGFIFFQEIFINYELYKRVVFEQIPKDDRAVMIPVLGVIMVVFLLPFFYVVLEVLKILTLF